MLEKVVNTTASFQQMTSHGPGLEAIHVVSRVDGKYNVQCKRSNSMHFDLCFMNHYCLLPYTMQGMFILTIKVSWWFMHFL